MVRAVIAARDLLWRPTLDGIVVHVRRRPPVVLDARLGRLVAAIASAPAIPLGPEALLAAAATGEPLPADAGGWLDDAIDRLVAAGALTAVRSP